MCRLHFRYQSILITISLQFLLFALLVLCHCDLSVKHVNLVYFAICHCAFVPREFVLFEAFDPACSPDSMY